jgi:WD40 repeat protein
LSLRLSTNRAIAVGQDGVAQLVNTANGSVVASLPNVASVALSPDGTQGAASRDGQIAVFNSASGKREAAFRAQQPITTLAISHDNQRLACGTVDGSILVWNLRDGHKTLSARVGNGPVRSLKFQPRGNILTTVGGGRFVVDTVTGQVLTVVTQ